MRPPDEVKRDLVRQWLAKAEEDYALADHLLTEGTPWWTATGFHCQQAAEKFIKALLVVHQVEFPKTHDIEELLDLAATIDAALAAALREASALTQHAVATRYPQTPVFTAEDAKNALALAGKVRDAILLALRDYLAQG